MFESIVRHVPDAILFLKSLGTKRKWIGIILAILIIGGVGYVIFGPKTTSEDTIVEEGLPKVALAAVSTFAENGSGSLSNAGSETVVRAETSGKIVKVVSVGSRIGSGTVIAQFDNAAQRAALLQAEGSLEIARASLQKTETGLRSEKLTILETAYESAKNNTVTTLLSAYATVDSAVRDTADQMFSNAESASPSLVFNSTNQQRRIDAGNQRAQLGPVLAREDSASLTISKNSNLIVELDTAESEVRQTREFLDTVIGALNEAVPTGNVTEATISAYKLSATNARTALTGSLTTIANARASLKTAEQNLDEGVTGAEGTDIAAADAGVKQAQGAYNAALASYEKTIVRSTVSGTIVSCSASVGDVISLGSDVCRIRTALSSPSDFYTLPLASVKYAPTGAYVFVISEEGTLEAVPVETGLVTATGINVTGLFGDEFIVLDVRGLKQGDHVEIQ